MEIKPVYKFKKNESFYIRDGWFEKALNTILDDENINIFSKNNGSKLLGIGTNMAKGLKYWLISANIIENSATKSSLTPMGRLIAKYDQYFESDFTWYLIHYSLCSNKYECPIFYAFFNSDIKKMRKSEIVSYICKELSNDTQDIKREYVDDDTSVFLKSYITDEVITNPEDNYSCPLSSLKLIKKVGDSIEKQKPSFNKLSSLIIYYVLSKLYGSNSFNIEDSFNEKNSPYLIFNLDKNVYLQYLEELQRNGYITINKTAGLNTVYFEKKLKINDIFELYFGGKE